MQYHKIARSLTNLDIVTLQQFADAQNKHEPEPRAFSDALMRLATYGFISGGPENRLTVTTKGLKFLAKSENPSEDAASLH